MRRLHTRPFTDANLHVGTKRAEGLIVQACAFPHGTESLIPLLSEGVVGRQRKERGITGVFSLISLVLQCPLCVCMCVST